MSFLNNYPLMVAVCGWVLAQFLKTILTLLVTREWNWERMIGAGGMPSAHSTAVCGMTVAIAKSCGVSDPLFALSFLFAMVVMYDATGVRRAAGEQAKRINTLFKSHDDTWTEMLKESLGHTPLEVLAGALLGIIMAMLMPM